MKSFSFLSIAIPLVVVAVASACDTSNAPIVPAGPADATTSSDAHAVSEASSDGPALVEAGSDGSSAAQDGPSAAEGGPDAISDASNDGSAVVCPSTTVRPQLSTTDAAQDTILGYLAQAGALGALTTDNWDPTAGLGDVTTFTPTFTVAATGGTHTSVQAAITAAAQDGGASRVYIRVTPGTYREVVCVPTTAPPITLYSTTADATQTVIVFNNFNGEALDSGAPTNPCSPPGSTATTFGTNGSATFAAFAKGFQAKNITFQNDVTTAMLGTTAGTQGVALYTQADQIVLENVRVLGHQDSLYIESPNSNTVVRAYVKSSYVAGDVDFIFGAASMVFDGCQIQFVSDRRAPTTALAPNTDTRNNFGILVINSQFTADTGTAMASADLGRAWDRSCVDIPTYVSTCIAAGHYPNGQAVVRNSTLDGHISPTPWVASATTKRPFCSTSWTCDADGGTCPANRLFEYMNTGPGAAN